VGRGGPQIPGLSATYDRVIVTYRTEDDLRKWTPHAAKRQRVLDRAGDRCADLNRLHEVERQHDHADCDDREREPFNGESHADAVPGGDDG
jgi:hypothetical protein